MLPIDYYPYFHNALNRLLSCELDDETLNQYHKDRASGTKWLRWAVNTKDEIVEWQWLQNAPNCVSDNTKYNFYASLQPFKANRARHYIRFKHRLKSDIILKVFVLMKYKGVSFGKDLITEMLSAETDIINNQPELCI